MLYVLLPEAQGLTYLRFLRFFLIAQLLAMLSMVPGGLGVLETAVVVLLSPYLKAVDVLGSMLVFRAIYYLLPLAFAIVLFGTYEAMRRREHVRRLAMAVAPWVPRIVPQALGIMAFAGGGVLLFSGATPEVYGRVQWLNAFVPMPVIEVSHFFASLMGAGLLVLGRGLQRRVRLAYVMTAVLLVLGVVFSLAKGFDYEEAILLTAMLAALVPSRNEFYREASVLEQPFTPGWIAAITAVMIATLWLAFFAHKNVEYVESWWHFLFGGGASLGIRTTLGVTFVMLAYALGRLIRLRPPKPALPSDEQIEKADVIVKKTEYTLGFMALTGDKPLLFSEQGNTFIMYGIEGRSWVSLGDPVGMDEEMPELVWRFREMVDRYDGLTIFHQVTRQYLQLYLDLGLTVLKLGEEAIVPLHEFSLEGRPRRTLRQARQRVLDAGGTFEIIPPQDVPAAMPDMRRVSDAWQARNHPAEHGFSIARFDPRYLRHFPVAVIRAGGQILGFANVMGTDSKRELSAGD